MSTAYHDHTLSLRGLNFHYLDWGTAGKPPFVLLHGGAQTAHSWDDFAPVVRADYHVYALDQRGHGDSDWAADGDYTRHTQAEDVAAFVAERGIAPHLLAGLSMGGINAITYTARYPERVRALIIVDVGPEIEQQGQENIQGFVGIDALDSFEAFVERAHRFNPRRSLDNLRQRLSHNLKQLPNGQWTWKFDQTRRGSGSLRSSLKPEELWQDVSTIRCPTLIVRGGESDILSPAAATRLQAAIPDSRLSVVPGAGHSVMGDNPDGFAAAVQAFLQSLG